MNTSDTNKGNLLQISEGAKFLDEFMLNYPVLDNAVLFSASGQPFPEQSCIF